MPSTSAQVFREGDEPRVKAPVAAGVPAGVSQELKVTRSRE
ncbi:hypothetical protein [Halomonas sp. LBP4]|nr:hypothetical protein [Halomonas sp. LBP4]